MRRRDILRLLSTSVLWRASARAAQPYGGVRRVGWIEASSAGMNMDNWGDVAREMQSLGWIRGGNVQVDRRVPFMPDDLTNIARELVAAHPDLIVTNGTPATVAVLAETRSIPVLFFGIADPVGNGLIGNLSRPGGNVTGFASYEPALAGKWVELLKEIKPDARRAAILFNPETTPNRASPFVQAFEATAHSFSHRTDQRVRPGHLRDRSNGCGPGARTWRRSPGAARLLHLASPPANYRAGGTVPRAGDLRPALCGRDRRPDRLRTQSRRPLPRIASYIDKILGGAKPGDLPIQAPTTYELVVNLRTARTLGLPIPQAIISAADEVIE